MCSIFDDRKIVARKPHSCNALNFIYEFGMDELMDNELDDIEKKELQELLDNNGKIQKGEIYRRYKIADNGTAVTLCESIVASQICSKYDLYPDC